MTRDMHREIVEERDRLKEALRVALEALDFYGDEETYHACMFMFDRPTGGFDDDFDQSDTSEYGRPMPGKTARSALTRIDQLLGDTDG